MKSKKALVASLAMAFTLSVAGTAFAAAGNPFVDVPSKHWSYGAVNELVKAGVVDGYGDGTFRGDKTITRYEMAQIVAKAMAKSDQADAKTKAVIDRLQAEYASELQGLNVRLTNVENKLDNVKFSGSVRERYEWVENPVNANDNPLFETRLRLAMTAPVGDGFTFNGRIQAKDEMGYAWLNQDPDKKTTKPWNRYTGSTVMVDQAYLSGKAGDIDVTFGRFPLTVGYGLAFDTGSNNDGIKIGFGNALKVTGGVMKDWGYQYYFGDVSYNLNKDLGLKVGYLKDQELRSDYKTTTAGFSYNGIKDVYITGEYGVNKARDAKALNNGENPKATTARVQFLAQDSAKKGSFDVWVGYRKADPGFDSFYWSTVDAPFYIADQAGAYNIKGWEVGVDYTLFRNATLSLNYADMKSNDGLDTNKKFFIGQVSYSF